MNAVIYARFSDEKQAGGYSIGAQLRACRDYAAKHGLKIVREYVDEARSAMKASSTREQFTEMMLDVRTKKRDFDIVIVHKSDRLGRHAFDALQTRAEFKVHGVRLLSVTETAVGGEEPEDQLLDIVLMGLNQHYSLNLGREAKKGLAERVRAGFLVTKAPYGYRRVVVKRDVGRRGKKPREYSKPEVHPEEARVVRLVFDLYDQGHGYGVIAAKLEDAGHRNRNGNKFTRSAINNILDREAYVGVFRWNKKQTGHYRGMTEVVVVDDFFPKIIDQRQWERVRARREQNRGNFQNAHAHTTQYLLSGLVWCGCGQKMNGRTTRRGTFAQYECKSFTRSRADRGCGARRWGKDVLEDQVVAQVAAKVLTTRTIKEAVAVLREKAAAERAAASQEVMALEEEARRAEAAASRWFDRVDDGQAEYEDVKPRIDELKAKAERLREQAREAAGRDVPLDLPPDAVIEKLVDHMREQLSTGDLFRRRGLVQALIKKVTVAGNGAVIEYRIPLGEPEGGDGNGGRGGGGSGPQTGRKRRGRPPKKKNPSALTEGCVLDALAPHDPRDSNRMVPDLVFRAGHVSIEECSPFEGGVQLVDAAVRPEAALQRRPGLTTPVTIRPRPATPPARPLGPVVFTDHPVRAALARARQLQSMIDSGEVASRAELARRLDVSRPRITQMLALLTLPEDIQHLITDEALRLTVRLTERRVRGLIASGDVRQGLQELAPPSLRS